MIDQLDHPGPPVAGPPIRFLDDADDPSGAVDPGLVILTCARLAPR